MSYLPVMGVTIKDDEADRRFGRGNHPVDLNFGDCFAYALAKSTGRPLLFEGEDFSRTDIPRAHELR